MDHCYPNPQQLAQILLRNLICIPLLSFTHQDAADVKSPLLSLQFYSKALLKLLTLLKPQL